MIRGSNMTLRPRIEAGMSAKKLKKLSKKKLVKAQKKSLAKKFQDLNTDACWTAFI